MLITFSPSTWYRLTTTSPSGKVLDVVNDAGSSSSGILQTTPLGNYSGQFWQIRAHADLDGTYELCTWFLGPDMRLGVDKERRVQLMAGGGKWRIVPHFEKDGEEGKRRWNGSFKLVNIRERDEVEGVCLDVWDPFEIADGNVGKCWRITPIREITTLEHLRP